MDTLQPSRLLPPFRLLLASWLLLMPWLAAAQAPQLSAFVDGDPKRDDFLRDYPAAFTLLSSGDDAQRQQSTFQDLSRRLGVTLDASVWKQECQRLSLDGKAAKLERARAFFYLGKYTQAEELALEAGDAAHRSQPRQPSTLIAALQLASHAALQRKDYDASLKYIKVAQGETDATYDISTWAQVESTIAHLYWLTQRTAEQIQILRQIQAKCEAILGAQHALTLFHHNELAAALFNDRQDAEAEKELKKILPITEKTAGPDDAKTQVVRKNLAKLIEGQERHPEAEALRRQVVESSKRRLGHDDLGTLKSRELLAQNLLLQRKFSECESETLGLLEISQSKLGAQHPMTFACRSRLIRCRRETLEPSVTEEQWRALYAEERKALGSEHLETISTAHELGSALNKTRKFEEATQLLKATLGDRLRLLPPDHVDTIETRLQLGLAYENSSRLLDAEMEYRAAIQSLTKQLGAMHPKTVQTTRRLNTLLNTPEAHELMIANARKIYTTAAETHGLNDTRALNARLSLASTLADLAKHAEAEQEYRGVHSSLTRLLNEENAESVVILREVGHCLSNQKKHAEAVEVYRRVLSNQRRLHEAHNPQILQTLYQLGVSLAQHGKLDEARTVLEECLASTALSKDVNPQFGPQVKGILDQIIQLQRQAPAGQNAATQP